MAKGGQKLRIIVAPRARADVIDILRWSERGFGRQAGFRYAALLYQAMRDLAEDPERPGSRERPDLAVGARSYHISYSRERVKSGLGLVRNPRHFLIYRFHARKILQIARVLHDASDLQRHMLMF